MFNFLFNFLYYLVTIVIGVFFLALGIFAMVLPWSSSMRTELIEFVLSNSIAISLFGFAFLVIGLTVLINLYLSSKRRYYYVRVGRRSIAIDEEIIQQYLHSYWRQLFPEDDVPTRLTLKRNKIKVFAELPHVPVNEQKAFIEHIKEDLQDIFVRILGYSHEFMLSLRFQSKPVKTQKTT